MFYFELHLRHETVVMSEAVYFGLGVEPAHPGHMHITPHKADAHVLVLGQVLQAGDQVVPLPMVLPYTAGAVAVRLCLLP